MRCSKRCVFTVPKPSCILRRRPMLASRSTTQRNTMRITSSGTLSLLKAMLEAGCRKLVFSSSCSIYGQPHEVPIRETAPFNPLSPYGASKAMVERILSDYARAYELQPIALRYFNASGADPEGELGELREAESRLIPRAMMAIQGHITDFAVFGDDYDTPDGTPIRDYIHVSDLADAHVAALRRLALRWFGRSIQPRHRSWPLSQASPRRHRCRNRRDGGGLESSATSWRPCRPFCRRVT